MEQTLIPLLLSRFLNFSQKKEKATGFIQIASLFCIFGAIIALVWE
jgi:hypothetical protein